MHKLIRSNKRVLDSVLSDGQILDPNTFKQFFAGLEDYRINTY